MALRTLVHTRARRPIFPYPAPSSTAGPLTVLLHLIPVAHAHTARRPPPPFTTYRKNVMVGYTTARSCRVVSCRTTAVHVGPIGGTAAAADRSHRTPPSDRKRARECVCVCVTVYTRAVTSARNVV